MSLTRKAVALKSFRGEPTDSLPFFPITMMFAADLVGRAYRDYATDARVHVAGQMMMAERFGVSLVSAISDPCVESADLGATVHFTDDAPPANVEEDSLLLDKSTLDRLLVIDPAAGKRMSNRLEVIRLLSQQVSGEVLVEGWVEGPCAEAADLRGINRIMMDFFDDEPFVETLLDFVTEQEIRFAIAQIDAGADIIGIGDAASSLVGPDIYQRFILPRTRRYIDAIHGAGALVRLHICGRIHPLFVHLAELDIDLIDIDSMNPVAEARSLFGDRTVICANLDPVADIKNGTPNSISSRLTEAKGQIGNRFAVGAGCEIPRGTAHANLDAMGDFARSSASNG